MFSVQFRLLHQLLVGLQIKPVIFTVLQLVCSVGSSEFPLFDTWLSRIKTSYSVLHCSVFLHVRYSTWSQRDSLSQASDSRLMESSLSESVCLQVMIFRALELSL